MNQARDEEFRAFVLARRSDLVRTAVLLTAGDVHLAEDLTQTTLTSLYMRWPAYRRAANPAAYARRCLVNALIDERRRPWRRERPTEAMPEGTDPASVVLPLDDASWARKYALITQVYGFAPDSWEARTCPRMEAFHCHPDPGALPLEPLPMMEPCS